MHRATFPHKFFSYTFSYYLMHSVFLVSITVTVHFLVLVTITATVNRMF